MLTSKQYKESLTMDGFFAQTFLNNTSITITVPATHVKFHDMKPGTYLKVYYKIVEQKEGDVNESGCKD